jgi:hypothetical protein
MALVLVVALMALGRWAWLLDLMDGLEPEARRRRPLTRRRYGRMARSHPPTRQRHPGIHSPPSITAPRARDPIRSCPPSLACLPANVCAYTYLTPRPSASASAPISCSPVPREQPQQGTTSRPSTINIPSSINPSYTPPQLTLLHLTPAPRDQLNRIESHHLI